MGGAWLILSRSTGFGVSLPQSACADSPLIRGGLWMERRKGGGALAGLVQGVFTVFLLSGAKKRGPKRPPALVVDVKSGLWYSKKKRDGGYRPSLPTYFALSVPCLVLLFGLMVIVIRSAISGLSANNRRSSCRASFFLPSTDGASFPLGCSYYNILILVCQENFDKNVKK